MNKKTILIILLMFSVNSVFCASSSKLVKDVAEMLEAGKISQADGLIDSALAVTPDDYNLLTSKGDILRAQDNFPKALEYYEKALANKSKDPDALYGAGMASLKIDHAQKALDYFERGVKTNKRKVDFLYGKALAQKELGLLADADETIRKAINSDKKNPVLHKALGDINFAKEVWSIALSEYQKALEFDSTQTDLYYKIARANFYSKNFTEAVKYYKEYLKGHDSDVKAWEELATICIYANLPGEAVFCYKKLTALQPENGDYWYTMGDMQFNNLHDYEAAGVSLEKAVALGSHTADAYLRLAKIYNIEQQYYKADSAYTRFEQELGPPDSSEYWFEKGKVMIKIGQTDATFFDRAIESFDMALSLDSSNAAIWEHAGLARYYKQDYAGAIPFFIKRIELGGENVNSLRNLAFCYLKTERYKEAAQYLEKAIVLKPDDAVMRQMIGRIYGFLGSGSEENAQKYFPDAIKHLKVALQDTTGAMTANDKCKMRGDIGTYYVTLREPTEAQSYLISAVKCDPNNVDYLYNLGMSYYMNNDSENAHEYAGRVLEINPDHKPAKELWLRTSKK